ncbi:MAG: mucoidy inhibitor MuiA family protein [Candidatus Omnitrophica bacterium]|nr:mucoidy inhibitor MuiA family protein [Candidatus Omnitrophota bacterium]
MKVRHLILPAAFMLVSVAPVSAASVEAVSKISSAVVYPSSARVTRATSLKLQEGGQTVLFSGVQPLFDENSLAVSGAGDAKVRILGAGIRTVQLTASPDQRVRELELKIQELDDQAGSLQGEAGSLADKKAFLDSVRLFSAGQIPKDLVTRVPSAEELKGTLTFLEGELKLYTEARQGLNVKLRETARARQALQAELDQLRSGGAREERVLAVDLECEKPGSLDLEVAYNLPAVSWYPLYDARVDFPKGKVALSAYAVVRQSTGEDWAEAQLTLSTARPAAGGRMPELAPWWIKPAVPRRERRLMLNAMDSAVMSKAVQGASGEAMELYEQAAPTAMPVPQKAETSYAQALTSGASLVYKAARPVTVKSDGSDVRVPLFSQTLDAAFEYAATPRLSPYAYLKAAVTNGSQDQLLAGRVNAFLDGTYVGASDVQKTVAPGESLDLYLGVDEGITVKRELVEEKADETLLGSIPSTTRKISYKYKMTVENYKPGAVTVNLFDQVPVSQDDRIKVVRVQTSQKPDSEKYKDREGVYLWTLSLQPKEKKEIWLSYVVECPRDLVVEGL